MKTTRLSKRFVASILIIMLFVSGCGEQSNTTHESKNEESASSYEITICQGGNEKDAAILEQGFMDAISDFFPQDHIAFTRIRIKNTDNGKKKIDKAISAGAQLLFTEGNAGLAAAAVSTSEIPIISTGVYDYARVLGRQLADEEERLIGRNITGVSAMPPMSSRLSLLIEATKHLKTVGIFYSPDEADAIFQNRQLETYLDQAGIPWKEYILPSKEYRKQLQKKKRQDDEPEPSDIVNTDTNNVEIPRISASWRGGKGKQTDNPKAYVTKLPKKASDKQVISYACKECSALYLPSRSSAGKKAALISQIATGKKVTTFGGDRESGADTLVTLYHDPYDSGYRSGQLAYQILAENENAGGIPLELPDTDCFVKLYQDTVAEKLKLTFPKSFEEYDAYFENYQPGMQTERLSP